LVPIASGQIDVQTELGGFAIRYTIRFTELLILSLLASVALAFALHSNISNATAVSVFVSLLPLIWLFGGNVVIALYRFPRLLRRAAETANAV